MIDARCLMVLLTGATQLNSSLLAISVFAVLLPAAFHLAANPQLDDADEGHDILAVSHGVRTLYLSNNQDVRMNHYSPLQVAIILLFSQYISFICPSDIIHPLLHLIVYAAYLAFQLYSHPALYDDTSIATTNYKSPKFYVPRNMKWHHQRNSKEKDDRSDVENKTVSHSNQNGSSTVSPSIQPITRRGTALNIQDPHSISGTLQPSSSNLHVQIPKTEEDKEDVEEEPKTCFPVTVGLLVVVAVVSLSDNPAFQFRG